MYLITVITSDNSIAESISNSPILKLRQDFEFAGTMPPGNNPIEFLKRTGSSMVFIDTDGQSPENIFYIEQIKRLLPEVYIVLLSSDCSFSAVRSGFISGIFDYLLLPLTDDSLEEVLLRLYSDLGGKYVFAELNELINPLINALETGCNDVFPYCNTVVSGIYKKFISNPVTGYIVSEKAKSYVYDELMQKIPWLRKFIFKHNFIHPIGAKPKEEYIVCNEWSAHFQTIADTIKKYSVLDNSLISNIGYYVINNVDEHLSLDDVSKGVFLNKSYISHIFKKVSGISFVNFITDVKIDRAKILLMNPNLKIYEIASQIGYNNPEYFSRVFKATTGITPNQYRSLL